MQYAEYLRRVEDQTGATRPSSEGERAITATLETLGERISGGEASDLAAQLPKELKEPLQRAGGNAEGFSFEEFLRRIGEREGVDTDEARNHASAVMMVLREAVSGDQLDDIHAQLPQEFDPLFRYDE